MHMKKMNNIDLEIVDSAEDHHYKPEISQVENWVKYSLMNDYNNISINLVLTTTSEMECLNINFRSKCGPTNVLSFPEEDNTNLVGEIIICSSVAAAEANDKPIAEYFLFLFIHGMLHLQGYDHIGDDEALIMEKLEQDILNKVLNR